MARLPNLAGGIKSGWQGYLQGKNIRGEEDYRKTRRAREQEEYDYRKGQRGIADRTARAQMEQAESKLDAGKAKAGINKALQHFNMTDDPSQIEKAYNDLIPDGSQVAIVKGQKAGTYRLESMDATGSSSTQVLTKDQLSSVAQAYAQDPAEVMKGVNKRKEMQFKHELTMKEIKAKGTGKSKTRTRLYKMGTDFEGNATYGRYDEDADELVPLTGQGDDKITLSEAKAMAKAEAKDRAGVFRSDKADFGPGGREKWTTDRTSEIMQQFGGKGRGIAKIPAQKPTEKPSVTAGEEAIKAVRAGKKTKPEVGALVGQHKFIGGDPSDPKNWAVADPRAAPRREVSPQIQSEIAAGQAGIGGRSAAMAEKFGIDPALSGQEKGMAYGRQSQAYNIVKRSLQAGAIPDQQYLDDALKFAQAKGDRDLMMQIQRFMGR